MDDRKDEKYNTTCNNERLFAEMAYLKYRIKKEGEMAWLGAIMIDDFTS